MIHVTNNLLNPLHTAVPRPAGDESLYECISDGFVALDHNFRYIYINHQTEKMFGLRKEDVRGKYIWDLYPEARGSIFEQKYRSVLMTRQPTHFEAFYAISQRWYEVRVYPTEHGLSIFYEDLTQQKQMEKQLHFLASIARSISDAVIATDNQNYIQSWNAAAERLYGWQEAEVIGKNAADILPTRFPYNPPKEWEEHLNSSGHWQGECIQKRKDGTEVQIHASVSLVKDDAGNVIGRVAANRDISERKLFEQSKDMFLTVASHELRTPLTTLKARVQLLKRMAEKRSLFDFVQPLTKMEHTINLLTKLVNMLVDGANIQLENPYYREELIAADKLISRVVTKFQKTCTTHTLTLSIQASAQIYGDRERLAQALTNLLENAVQYSPRANRVDIVLSVHNNESVNIAIQDYGEGISKQDQAAIFERFGRKYSTAHKTPPGMGLGLSIANEIVKRHRGTISITSEDGKGSLFSVSLPIAK